MTTENTGAGTRQNDSFINTFTMAFVVSLVCSVLVSTSVILLEPIQEKNEVLRSSIENMLPIIQSMQLDVNPEELPHQLEARSVDLSTGAYVEDIDVTGSGPGEDDEGFAIPEDEDIAGIGQRSRYATVYLIMEDSRIKYILLPVYGRGMWSIIRGYLALENDANTIAAIKFYEHGETPGIGDKIDENFWLMQWRGKLVYENNAPAISVVKSRTPTTLPYEVDAITGATLTSLGISRLLQYWLGKNGFQPFLDKLREARGPE
jgi:Na+-transporting NADH:ubiquinone oxidoreductase subunit C